MRLREKLLLALSASNKYSNDSPLNTLISPNFNMNLGSN